MLDCSTGLRQRIVRVCVRGKGEPKELQERDMYDWESCEDEWTKAVRSIWVAADDDTLAGEGWAVMAGLEMPRPPAKNLPTRNGQP